MTIEMAEIDFSELMDLRVDYAFKLFFATSETHRLVSLLNAIFEHKQIPRVVAALTIENPSLEKAAAKDKLSVLDIRATLDDGNTLCIEMHLYDLIALKYKTLRSWARVYGEDLVSGENYTQLNQVICISFMNGPVTDATGVPVEKIHSLFQAMERDSHEVLLPDMEIHFIDMKAFVKSLEEKDVDATDCDEFTKWLMLINEKAINNKKAIKRICSEGELKEAMKTLTRLSKDKIKRQAYQRRLDELYFYNAEVAKKEAVIAEQCAVIADKDAALADKDAALADKEAVIAEQGAVIADKDAIIAKLTAQLDNRK